MRNALTETVFGDRLDQQLTLVQALELLYSMDLINMPELSEKYAAAVMNSKQCAKNTPKIDLENGAQVKFATVKTHYKTDTGTFKQRAATISINGTTSDLHCVVHDPSNHKIYLFEVPQAACKLVSGNTFKIGFTKDSKPNYNKSHWWRYQVKNFNKVPG